MRDLIDALFAQIGAPSLTDEEFEALTIESVGIDVASYTALLAVLDARETVSEARTRLTYYYLARGVAVTPTSAAKSNIYIGDVLE